MPGDCWTAKNLTIDWIFSHQGGAQQAALNSAYLFGRPGLAGSGWVPTFFPQSRGELFFMLDQGYATGDQKIEPSLTHFPQWANLSDPGARLLKFNRAVQAHGWRGLGLWNRIQGDDAGQAYARQAANWSRFANISYWKIDGPDGDCKASDAAKEVFPELIVEHGFCPVTGCPLNDPSGSGTYSDETAERVMGTLGCSDVFRSYDTTPTLSIPTTLSRLSSILTVANTSLPKGGRQSLLNGDAESLVSASLGCLIGVMRAPLTGLRPKIRDAGMSEARDVDLFFAGNRQAKKRMDEVDRIVRWGRLAPPFGARAAAGTDMRRDGVLLCDHWAFEPGDTWKRDAWGKTLKQCAPARVTRGGLPLPSVVRASAGTAPPPTPAYLTPCASGGASPNQLLTRQHGTWKLGDGSGRCLQASRDQTTLLTGDCSVASQFLRGDDSTVSLSGTHLCLTANCTELGPTPEDVVCEPRSALTLRQCNPLPAKDPQQRWSTTLADDASGSSLLELISSNWTTAASGCVFEKHSSGIDVSAGGQTATGTGARGNQVATGSCHSLGRIAGGSTVLNFTLAVKALSGEAFIGVTNSSSSGLPNWANSLGAYGYGSQGLRASKEVGYRKTGIDIDPRTGRLAALQPWAAGDTILVTVSAAGTMSVAVNGGEAVAIFDRMTTTQAHPFEIAVWMAPGSSSAFTFGGAGGVPACLTATPAAKTVPFVVATRYPSGAVSVTSLARTSPRPLGYHTPLAHVTQQTLLGSESALMVGGIKQLPPIAVFGTFGSLALGFQKGMVDEISAIHAQDLRGDASPDILRQVELDKEASTLTLPGALVTSIGTQARSHSQDLSEPGCVLIVELRQTNVTSTRM